jgi:hypothetical protein
MSVTPPLYIAGLDLGRPHEFTALAVLERTEVHNPNDPERMVRRYAVRHLKRLSPATPYPEVFARLAEVFAAPPVRDSRLVVDYTGVGRPVLDMLRKARWARKSPPCSSPRAKAPRRMSVAVGWCRGLCNASPTCNDGSRSATPALIFDALHLILDPSAISIHFTILAYVFVDNSQRGSYVP